MSSRSHVTALRLLQAADAFRARLAGEFSSIHGMSVNEFFALAHLDAAPQRRLSRVELARRMHVSPSTITRMTAPMEKIGFVGRQPDERDARLSFVVLTDAGAERLGEAQATFAKHAERLFSDRWEAAEVRVLSDLLHRLTAGSSAALA